MERNSLARIGRSVIAAGVGLACLGAAPAMADSSGPGGVGGTVGPTLSVTLGPAPAFGPFTPGVANNYYASTTATVTSTAGNAALIIQDTSPYYTNHLVNGAYAMPQELQVRNNFGSFQTMPAGLRFWGAPTTGEVVPIDFMQPVAANDGLRTGTYAKAFTVTLSTTAP